MLPINSVQPRIPPTSFKIKYAKEAPLVGVSLEQLRALMRGELDPSAVVVQELSPPPSISYQTWNKDGTTTYHYDDGSAAIDYGAGTAKIKNDTSREQTPTDPNVDKISDESSSLGSCSNPSAPRPDYATVQSAASANCDLALPEELNEREREILVALFLLDAVTRRRRRSRLEAARKAHPHSPPSTYNRPIASLVERELVHSKRGRDGGIWLTPSGITAAQLLQGITLQ